ncbi:MAG TPA: alpha/beta hydrolase [Sedimentisphaerales bacterium]|nr:alpha/beta hydrolase [Sedimentisphaerales bacterium]
MIRMIRNRRLAVFRNRMTSTLMSIAAVLLVAYVGLGLFLLLMQHKFVYYPVREISCTPADIGLDFESVDFTTADGQKLNGWYVPAPNSRFTILFCHGNAGNIMHRLDSINIFCKLGLSCFIFDYRGYGRSQGKPSEEGTYLDAGAAYKWLTEKKEIPHDEVIIFGRSLGGCVAAHLARSAQPKALVTESTFTSYVDMGRKFYPYMPVRWFARFSYNAVDYIRDVHCPVMIVHSANDEIVPFEFGHRLYEAANEPKQFVEIFGGHNDGFILSGDAYTRAWAEWLNFLEEYREGSTAKPGP